jgi:hypothetical protein
VISPIIPSRPYRRAPVSRYQAQDCGLTLEEGLAEYYALNRGGVSEPPTFSPLSQVMFRNHDICHVIFGLDTTLADEILVDWRTRLSTDVGWARYAEFYDLCPEVRPIFARVGHLSIGLATLRENRRIARAMREATRMPKIWPWDPPASLMTRTLRTLRRDYGIVVF